MQHIIDDTYQLTQLLGEGGNAKVYLANDISNKQFAIKVLDC